MAEHMWSGEDKKAYTKILIGKKYSNIPSGYKFRSISL